MIENLLIVKLSLSSWIKSISGQCQSLEAHQ